jgi:DHA2 family multidrug resistance protein
MLTRRRRASPPLQQTFLSKGFGPATALKQAYCAIKLLVRRDAFIMAFNDAFLVIAIGLLVAAATIWACKEPKKAKRRAKL